MTLLTRLTFAPLALLLAVCLVPLSAAQPAPATRPAAAPTTLPSPGGPRQTVIVDDISRAPLPPLPGAMGSWLTEAGGRYQVQGLERSFWIGGYHQPPGPTRWSRFHPAMAASFGKHRPEKYIVLDLFDLDHWQVITNSNSDDALVNERLAQAIELVRAVRKGDPSKQIGIYNLCVGYWPARWELEGAEPANVEKWKKGNDRLAPLIAELDFLCVAGYQYYHERDVKTLLSADANFARGSIREARRIAQGKPVVVYTSPYVEGQTFIINEMSSERWTSFVSAIVDEAADAIVIWGDGLRNPYNRNALAQAVHIARQSEPPPATPSP